MAPCMKTQDGKELSDEAKTKSERKEDGAKAILASGYTKGENYEKLLY